MSSYLQVLNKNCKKDVDFAVIFHTGEIRALEALQSAKPSSMFTPRRHRVTHYIIRCRPYGRDGRVVEGARLESVYTSKGYRGFESLSLRHELCLIEVFKIIKR